MGSRGRSIRLRIYFLVAVPLIMMLGLAGVFAYSSVLSYRNVTRAPKLILATAEQSTKFVLFLQAERRAALVYLASPNSQTLGAYQAAINATKTGAGQFQAAMNSSAVTSAENAQEAAAINKMISDINNMSTFRLGVQARKVTALQAFGKYSFTIADEPRVFQAEASSFTDSGAATRGFGLIEVVQVREDLDQVDSILAGALASGKLTPTMRAALNQAAGRQTDEQLLYPALLGSAALADYNASMSTPQTKTADAAVQKVEQAIEAGYPLQAIEAQGMSAPAWQGLTAAWSNASYQGGLNAATTVLRYDQGVANNAKNRLIVVGSIGLAGLLFTLIVTMLLARSVNRRLSLLRRNAVALATEYLPNVVARLRRGDSVDLAAEAPPLRVGADEIGQVGQAFDMVRQTALRSAIEESRLRQGVNDMFRNLARRNQSLLQRQLTMLDGMERRATDPDVLDDLFKMDHLTTRMRRHAEGLIILSGAAPGRGWSTPVKLIDVMRGAVAEVEDFARVIVTSQSKAALTGGAVTDVIHLLAELIENATTLSPPFTQVRVHGEMVANGFAIEIEDRGLGMTPMRMNELNERLANPPDVNPTNTEQLGLFVVGQLARRNSINIVLRPSPYGGTTAVVMIPARLVVNDSTPAIATGPQPVVDSMPGAAPGFGSSPFGSSPFGPGPSGPGGTGGNMPGAFTGAGGSGGPAPGNGFGGNGFGGNGSYPAPGGPPDLDNIPLSSPFGTPGPSANGGGFGLGPDAGLGTGPGGRRSPNDPVITGVPVTRPTARPAFGDFPQPGSDGRPPMDGPPLDSAPFGGAPAPGSYSSSSFYGNPGAPGGAFGPGNADGTGNAGGMGNTGVTGSPDGLSNTGPSLYDSSSPNAGNGYGNNGGADGSYDSMNPGSSGDTDGFKGLPRRVRQQNLAPQLRKSSGEETGISQASAPNPADVKNTLSAMQRGWKQGRSQTPRDTKDR